jgi:succinoglycan biosynthesis protein ExoO
VGPAVSVIIPAYNAGKYVGEAIASVLAQTVQDFEIIVVDDGSADNTADVVSGFADPRIRLLKNEINRGPSYSRNRAMAESSGKWIAVLDADDWWHERRLEFLLSAAGRHQAEIVADNLFLIRDGEWKPWTTYFQSRESVIGKLKPVTRVDALKMIRDDYGYLKPLFSASLIRKHGIKYSEDLRYGEDFRFLLECLLAGATMLVYREPYYYYRIRENSLSSNPVISVQDQIRSTEQLMRKYGKNKKVARALKKYKTGKEMVLIEASVRELIREGRIFKTTAAVFRHPLVIRPFLRSLIKG